ncbi:hypothetical protein BUALT_Bualt01G0218500 [Buddleja alternifolia]|uniref:LysM domain-containing protein n=1 Tax=Buddleja alternifolia TaxID=168488 RepID=A0AAV6YJY1_9LAMI|nr:hypothetical protein BUALT_Bualt01G0218500 [Buddleja alternifolia]
MASTSSRQRTVAEKTQATAWFCASLLLFAVLLTLSSKEDDIVRGNQLIRRACEEIYVVGEGETLQTISEKCGDPFIVEQNPHIHDPDDVFPGLVIKITPFLNSRNNFIYYLS